MRTFCARTSARRFAISRRKMKNIRPVACVGPAGPCRDRPRGATRPSARFARANGTGGGKGRRALFPRAERAQRARTLFDKRRRDFSLRIPGSEGVRSALPATARWKRPAGCRGLRSAPRGRKAKRAVQQPRSTQDVVGTRRGWPSRLRRESRAKPRHPRSATTLGAGARPENTPMRDAKCITIAMARRYANTDPCESVRIRKGSQGAARIGANWCVSARGRNRLQRPVRIGAACLPIWLYGMAGGAPLGSLWRPTAPIAGA
jgi:hypothetical protein